MARFLRQLGALVGCITGRSIFQAGFYREAELTRLLNLFAHVDLDRWRGLKVLEVGAGLGHMGRVLAQMGFDVTSTDGRPQYVERMKAEGRPAFVLDLDRTGVDEVGDFDLVFCFGVLYHLAEPERFLLSCGRKARVLLLETAVCDARQPVLRRDRLSSQPCLGRAGLPVGWVRLRAGHLQPDRQLVEGTI